MSCIETRGTENKQESKQNNQTKKCRKFSFSHFAVMSCSNAISKLVHIIVANQIGGFDRNYFSA